MLPRSSGMPHVTALRAGTDRYLIQVGWTGPSGMPGASSRMLRPAVQRVPDESRLRIRTLQKIGSLASEAPSSPVLRGDRRPWGSNKPALQVLLV